MDAPTEAMRNEQINRNLAMVELLKHEEGDKYLEWCAVGVFYAAVHLVQNTIESKLGIFSVNNHKERNEYIKTNGQLRAAYKAYMALYNMSRYCRYDCYRPNINELENLMQIEFCDVKSVCDSVKGIHRQ